MIVGLKNYIPYVIQVLTDVSINGQWLANKMEDNIKRLVDINFHVLGIVTDNHSTSVRAFSNILNKYGNSNFSLLHRNNHSKRTYLYFDTVHFMKDIRNNLLNSKKLVFPAFEFSDFNIQC